MGYATITHPFHSLKGKRYEILSTKNFNRNDILSLRTENGVIAILRAWTDRADPNIYVSESNPTILSGFHLHRLQELLKSLGMEVLDK